MPFDPLWPQNGQLADGDKLRDQFISLKTLIDAGGGSGGITDAQVDGVNTTDPASPALAQVSLTGSVLHFTFTLPRGNDGQQGLPGQPGMNGNDGGPGPIGPQGPPFATAVVDSVTTLPPGSAATVSVAFDGTNVRFTFGIPAGFNGTDGANGTDGTNGTDGAPGEVSTAQMDAAIASALSGTSANTNAVPTLDIGFAIDPPTLADLETMRAAYNTLVLALRKP